MKPFFHKLEFRGAQEVSRFWPMEKRGRIVLDPARQFGRPIDAQTGVPTKAIYDACRAGKGQGAREVARWFHIPVSAVQAAVAFERSLLEQNGLLGSGGMAHQTLGEDRRIRLHGRPRHVR